MIVPTEPRTYRVSASLEPMQWANWEDSMQTWGFVVVSLDAGGTLDDIFASRGDFVRAVPESGKDPRSQAVTKAWNSIRGVVARANWDGDQTVVRTGDVIEWDDMGRRTHRFYSAKLLNRLSEGEEDALLMNVTGVGIGTIKFLAGLVGIARENPDFFAESSQRAAEVLQAQATMTPGPVV